MFRPPTDEECERTQEKFFRHYRTAQSLRLPFPAARLARSIDMPDGDTEDWRIRTGAALARFLKD